MNVPQIDSSITYTQKYSKNNAKMRKHPNKSQEMTYSSATSDALKSAGAWFGFGVGLDLISRKFPLSKSPTKNSIMTNGIIAGIAGLFTLIHDLCIKHKS